MSTVSSVPIFQKGRKQLISEVTEIRRSLENKKIEMFAEIESVENENLSKQRQKQKKINKLNALIEQTEELADNSLLEVQNRIIQDLQNELSIASIQESDCSVEFEWGFSRDVISKINSITLKRLDTDKDEGRAQPNLLNSPLTHFSDPNLVSGFIQSVEFVNASYLELENDITDSLPSQRGTRGGFHERYPAQGYNRESNSDRESNVNRERRSRRGRIVTIQEGNSFNQGITGRELSESNRGEFQREPVFASRERSGLKQGNSNIESAVDKQRKYATNRTTYNEQPSGFNCDNTFSHRRYRSGTDKVRSKQESTNLSERVGCEIDPDSIVLSDNYIEDYIDFVTEDNQEQIYPRDFHQTTTQATPDTLSKPNLFSNTSDINIISTSGGSRVVPGYSLGQLCPNFTRNTFDGSIAGPEGLQTNQSQNNNINTCVTPATAQEGKCNIL